MIPQVLYDTHLFMGGISFAGDVPSVTLPKLTVKTESFRGGGMGGEIELDVGLEKLEASFVTIGVRREAMKFFGLADQTSGNAVFRGAFKGLGGKVTPVIATMRGLLKELDMGDWKPGEKAESKYAMALQYYKLEVEGRVIYEIDMVNCVRVIDGVDQMADVRSAIGL